MKKKSQKKIKQKHVVCDVCKKKYPPAYNLKVGETTTQGWKCAAYTYCQISKKSVKWFLQCSYGSMMDYNLYLFNNIQTTHMAVDPICDKCINKLIKDKSIKYIGEML